MKEIILRGQPGLWILGNPYALGNIPIRIPRQYSEQYNFLYSEVEMYSSFFYLESNSRTFLVSVFVGSFLIFIYISESSSIAEIFSLYSIFSMATTILPLSALTKMILKLSLMNFLVNLRRTDNLLLIGFEWEEEVRKLLMIGIERFLIVNYLLII